MREAEFKEWLEAQGYSEATVAMHLNRARLLAQSYGDLGELFKKDKLKQLQQELAYSKEDERLGKPNPARFSVDGNLYKNMATYRQTITYYRRFEMGESSKPSNLQAISRESIEAAMDEFDEIGLN